mmetsp:Transcript_2284/g.3286  ORF Transcript_2284/g.3286 Transcript_2284/m.3286 type:complete len:212 (-) Transcript_2284:115-750(-)
MVFQESIIHISILLPIGFIFHKLNELNDQTEIIKFCALFVICSAAFIFTHTIIPFVTHFCIKARLSGKDINKKGTKQGEIDIPESLGIAPATVFLVMMTMGIVYQNHFNKDYVLSHISAVLSISYAVYLGFCDDVFDLKWRHKLWLPFVATLPLLVAYSGVTHIIVPSPLRIYIGYTIELGLFYYIYMTLLTVFCTNSINIYAGLNGLEVG